MAEYPKLTMTNKAIEMITESQLSGANLEITKVKIGDGLLADGTDIKSMTDVVSNKMEAPMTSYKSDGAGQLSVNFAISNANLDAGFFAREIGIFAKLTDGEETLYAYTNAGNKCDWIPDKGTPIDSQVVDATLIIGNASSVTVRLADKAYALVQDLEDHNLDPKAHPNLNLDGFQIGDIKWSSVDLTQVGWLVANGAEVGRDPYPDLNEYYASKGYPWGAGDGATTFNLPNLIGRFPEGANQAGGYHKAGLPNITGVLDTVAFTISAVKKQGALAPYSSTGQWRLSQVAPETGDRGITFDASLSNPIYGNSDTVQPPSALLIPYVKAFKGASADSTDLEITKVANEVANKANRDLSNLSETGRKAFFPSETFVNIPVDWTSEAVTTYTAPTNGFIYILGEPANTSASRIRVDYADNRRISTPNNGTSMPIGICLPVKTGSIVSISSTNCKNTGFARFYYAEGEVPTV